MALLRIWLARAWCAALLFVLPAAAIAADAAPSPARPALWRAHNGDSTLYLFGSLHILPPGYVWTTPAIEAAMAASDLFIFEVPIDEATFEEEKQFIVENGFLARQQTLRGLLSQIEFQRYSSVMKRAGLKPFFYERYQPWLAALVLGLAYLHGDNIVSLNGADDAIKDYARELGKSLLYLETPREQMALLNRGNHNSQLKALKNLLISLPRVRTQDREMRQTWSGGDAKAFTALLEGYFEGRPEAQELLINGRNRNWMPALKQSLARHGGTTMLTVGAAHIGGKMGLIGLLCGQGYEVERVGEGGQQAENACGPEA